MHDGAEPLGSASVSTVFLRPIVETAVALGVDRAALLERVGMTPESLDDREARVPVELERHLWHEAARATGDDDFGLHIAERAPPGAFDVLDYAGRASATLGEAYERVARYQRLMHSGFVMEVVPGPDRVVLQQVARWSTAVSRHTLEAWAASIVGRTRLFTGRDWTPLEVEFPHPAPAAVKEHRRIFGARVSFDRAAVRVHVERSMLERPLVTADENLCAMIDDYAQARLARVPDSESLADRVRALVVNATKGGDPGLAAIAARLHLHPRVLQRRLQREGASHQQILDEVRRKLAGELMERSEMAICEVAYLLGYADPSAFHRAFKRWTGSTPVMARRQGR